MQRTPEPLPHERALERRAGQALLVLCLISYAFVIPRGAQHNPDSRLALTYALVDRASVAIDEYAAGTADRAVRDRRTYSDKAPGVSLWLAPLYAVLRLLPLPDAALPVGERFITRYLLTYLGIGIPHAAFAVWLFHRLRNREAALWPRLAVLLGYALGSPAYAFSVHAFGHVPAAICLYVGGVAARGAGPRAALGGALLAGAVAFEYPAALPAAALAGLSIVWAPQRRRSLALRLVAGALPVTLLVCVYHTLAFGAPWRTGYQFVDPAGPFAAAHSVGLFGVQAPDPKVAIELLFGARRGLFVVAPWLVLVVPGALLAWRGARRDVVCALVVTLPLLAVNAGYVVWDGGASWGPRHLVATLPFLAVLSLRAIARWRTVGWLLVGCSVLLTSLSVSTGTLPPAGTRALDGFLLPALNGGGAGNTLGALVGLSGWRGLVGLGLVAVLCGLWIAGPRRGYGVAFVCAIAGIAAARLDQRYAEYAEGYYLYLGSRVAAGATLYRDVESTQAPLVTLLAATLWRVLPGVYAPRLAAIVCWALAAVLAGRLAVRLTGRRESAGPATVLAALLPLGATGAATFDANAVLAPLAPALALLLTRPLTGVGAPLAAILSAVGIASKLTFVPFVIAPIVIARQKSWRFALATLIVLVSIAIAVLLWAGPAARDALFGELESPLLPAGALLAVAHLVQIEGVALVIAGFGLWRLRSSAQLHPAHAVALAGALLPLLALHQGTFVSVARPAEPLIAAYAIAGIHALNQGPSRLRALVFASLFALVVAFPLAAITQAPPAAHRPQDRPIQWIETYARPGEALVTPPFFAARAARAMVFDYADWTVLGMRAAAGVEPERTYAALLREDLERASFPFVIADFRLGYIPGAIVALQTGYERTADDGEGALAVTLWLPKTAR